MLSKGLQTQTHLAIAFCPTPLQRITALYEAASKWCTCYIQIFAVHTFPIIYAHKHVELRLSSHALLLHDSVTTAIIFAYFAFLDCTMLRPAKVLFLCGGSMLVASTLAFTNTHASKKALELDP